MEGSSPGPILVVEDDRPTRELLAAILKDEQLPFKLCANGHEAMDQARLTPPGMIVLDIHLPSLQGEALATSLRIEHGAGLPILATSAGQEARSAERIGAYAYLQKPFTVDEFVQRVREGVALARGEGDLRRPPREQVQRLAQRQRQAFDLALNAEPFVPPADQPPTSLAS